MPKCEKSSKQNSEPTTAGDYPNKGKLGDMGPDPRMGGYKAPLDSYPHTMPHISTIVKTRASIAVSLGLGAKSPAPKLR